MRDPPAAAGRAADRVGAGRRRDPRHGPAGRRRARAARHGRVDAVITGCDRVAANGDTANKIGTYSLALAANYHDVPFYVAGPRSTLDPHTATGADIEIEQRDGGEVRAVAGLDVSTAVWNPAFDVTPAELITGLITDAGVLRAPYGPAIAGALS